MPSLAGKEALGIGTGRGGPPAAGYNHDAVAPLEAHETIAAWQQRESLGVCIFLVGQWLPVFARQLRESCVREPHQPVRAVEDESCVEQNAEVPHGSEPVRAGDLEIRQAVQLVCLAGCQYQAAGVDGNRRSPSPTDSEDSAGRGTASILIGLLEIGATGRDCGAASTPPTEATTATALSHALRRRFRNPYLLTHTKAARPFAAVSQRYSNCMSLCVRMLACAPTPRRRADWSRVRVGRAPPLRDTFEFAMNAICEVSVEGGRQLSGKYRRASPSASTTRNTPSASCQLIRTSRPKAVREVVQTSCLALSAGQVLKTLEECSRLAAWATAKSATGS